jgi:hypothetical protein
MSALKSGSLVIVGTIAVFAAWWQWAPEHFLPWLLLAIGTGAALLPMGSQLQKKGFVYS